MSEQITFRSYCNWLLGDHLGSTSMVADASGAVVNELRYSAFGEIRYQNGTLTTDYSYTGQRQEAEIGLYYFVARWYDPAIGRFIQADTVVPNPGTALGYDRYGYNFNNPIKYIDPDGHNPLLIFAFIGAVWAITSALQRAEVSTMEAATTSQQPEFKNEQTSIQQWSDNCMGQCHYAHAVSPAPYQTAGGPKPYTPLTDNFSTNVADATTNFVTAAGGFISLYGLSIPKAPKLSDFEVRSQYLDDLSTIPDSIDPYLSYKDQAYTAVELCIKRSKPNT